MDKRDFCSLLVIFLTEVTSSGSHKLIVQLQVHYAYT